MRTPSSRPTTAASPRPAPLADDWPTPLVGPSASAARARAAFADALRVDAPVLIAADAGLDAAAVARAIHDRTRAGAPFLTVDCAADPVRVDRELFGATAADRQSDVDRLAAASPLLRARDGTVYLTHLADLPAAAQRRLARIVRDREVRANGRRVAVRARIIAQASPSIDADVRDGHVRADLFRRVAQIAIAIAALRERAEDIPALAARIGAAFAGPGGPAFTQAALTVLAAPPWTGNLDELRGVLEKALRTAANGTVRQEDVLAHLPIDGAFSRIAPQVSLREARRQFERDYIAAVLERHRWRMSDAARTLGIERANLYRKTRQLGIVRRGTAAVVS
jgi:DNA-binding NtrC family response regulator